MLKVLADADLAVDPGRREVVQGSADGRARLDATLAPPWIASGAAIACPAARAASAAM